MNNEQIQAERQAITEGLKVALHYGKEDEVYVKGIALAIHSRLAELRKPSEPTFCPDCGNRVRLSGNGVAEQLCTCRKWPESNTEKKPSENLVEEIAKLIEDDLIQSYAPNFYDEDDGNLSLLDLFSHTDTIDSGRENIKKLVDSMDCVERIANLAPFNPNAELPEWLRQWKKDQIELLELTKNHGHPMIANYTEGGLDMLTKIIEKYEK